MHTGEAAEIEQDPAPIKRPWFVLFDPRAGEPRGYVYTRRSDAEDARERYFMREQRRLNVVPVLAVSIKDLES